MHVIIELYGIYSGRRGSLQVAERLTDLAARILKDATVRPFKTDHADVRLTRTIMPNIILDEETWQMTIPLRAWEKPMWQKPALVAEGGGKVN